MQNFMNVKSELKSRLSIDGYNFSTLVQVMADNDKIVLTEKTGALANFSNLITKNKLNLHDFSICLTALYVQLAGDVIRFELVPEQPKFEYKEMSDKATLDIDQKVYINQFTRNIHGSISQAAHRLIKFRVNNDARLRLRLRGIGNVNIVGKEDPFITPFLIDFMAVMIDSKKEDLITEDINEEFFDMFDKARIVSFDLDIRRRDLIVAG